ncbi:MAG: 4-vinyl reductase [Chloroflexota bacterium]
MTRTQSGLYYPNKPALIILLALENVMGKNGINAILNLGGLSHLIDHYPPDDLKREFDFADLTSLFVALEEMYGPRGGRGLALRAGRATFDRVLRDFGPMVGMADLAFKVLPLEVKMKVGLRVMGETLSKISDQINKVEDAGDHYLYKILQCPQCWERKTDKPCCHMAVGLLQEGLHWLSGGKEFRVVEIACIAMGHESCDYAIYKEPLS